MTTTRAVALAAAVLVLVTGPLAACGADDGSGNGVASLGEPSAASDAGSGGDGGGDGGRGDEADQAEFQDAMLEYAQCMRDHGIDMPDPTFDDGRVTIQGKGPGAGSTGGAGGEEDAFAAADEACHSIIEDVAPEISLSPEEQAELQDKMLAMAECMRAKGHDMPDPQVSDKGAVQVHVGDGGDGGGPDLDDPGFQEDMQACSAEAGLDAPVRAGRSGGGAGGGTTGSGGSE
jgi:hypothetical protein